MDGAMNKEEFVRKMEEAVLGVMDDVVRDYLDAKAYGYEDADLEVFVDGIRQHAARVYERYS